MAPVRSKRRISARSSSPTAEHIGGSPSTPHSRSPIKKRRMGLNPQQKQVLIDNLQLEITERARRLRAQYHLQAQGLRSRIQIRINRIPTSLRKVKMGDLLLKYLEQEKRKAIRAPPPVPSKDRPAPSPQHRIPHRAASPQRPGRPEKHSSDELIRDKENNIENAEQPKKRIRGNPATEGTAIRAGQVLSPTSSNTRLAARDRPTSPTKSQIARPGSPLKGTGTGRTAAATNVLTSMVEKARATRDGAARKLTTASNTSSSSSGTTAAARTRRAAAPAAPKPPTSRPGTRMARRVSGNSEASENSTGTVIRKTASAKPAAAAPRRTVMSTIKKGVTGGGARKTAPKPTTTTAATTTRSGRVLRGRG
ncbi:hypothetical protein S40285_01039 [Stachybotrys chlorohalonatus IBT 40285]|uniref:Borealin N-terminal domain-containing protein n=1 Tax=Stachybotrys chlorohalonatus (strain IBT 40285) TaxID=1283841 RepID=A0A084QKC3_STAC4|nr:hypothetical protein S40285_01039 [Stachybotrys chlorohalonata IBT 40285]